jgi:flagellar biosynthesis GTPase FlhF
MASTAITKPEVRKLETTIEKLRGEIKSLAVIKTAEEYTRAGTFKVAINNYEKDVHATLDPFVEIPRRAYEAARQERQKYLNMAEELKGALAGPMSDFKRQERLAAEAEERRINEERRKQAEEEAEKQRKEAAERAEAERKRQQKQIEEARKAGEIGKREADKLKKQAEEEAERAKEQAAQDAKLAAENVQEVKVLPSVPKVAGLRGRVNYYAAVVDADALLKAWANGRTDLRKFIYIDEKALNEEARKVKDSKKLMEMIPGIRAYDEDSI